MLAPLADRYGHWLRLDPDVVLADREEAAQDVRAMQLLVRMERSDPPSWHLALAAAATAAAAVCLNPRSEPGGDWHDAIREYCAGHIRKVTRRARGAHWLAAQALPGLVVDLAGTQVRALLPGLVTELDSRISRLQVGGTDVAADDPPDAVADRYATDRTGSLTLWLPPDTPMTLGKAMAQTGHAGMIAAALLARDDQPALRHWVAAGCPSSARRTTPHHWQRLTGELLDHDGAFLHRRLLAVRDAGFTEVDPGTVTVIAAAPTTI